MLKKLSEFSRLSGSCRCASTVSNQRFIYSTCSIVLLRDLDERVHRRMRSQTSSVLYDIPTRSRVCGLTGLHVLKEENRKPKISRSHLENIPTGRETELLQYFWVLSMDSLSDRRGDPMTSELTNVSTAKMFAFYPTYRPFLCPRPGRFGCCSYLEVRCVGPVPIKQRRRPCSIS